jgi:hypothetical protein
MNTVKRTSLLSVCTFLTAFGLGWASAPPVAECRMCNSKTCFSDRSCGKKCQCMFEGGKREKKGVCVQLGD